MYKSRIHIWIIVIVIALVITNADKIKNVSINIFDPNIEVKVESEDIVLKQNFQTSGNLSYIDFDLVNHNQADMIITEVNTPPEDDMYLYSPMVLYFDSDVKTESFNDAGSNMYTKDLSVILNAILEDKSWKDIGFKNMDGKVKLVIPSENARYFEETILLFENNLPTAPKEETAAKINIIISKCKSVEDITTYNDLNKKTAVIAPEFVDIEYSTTVYPTKTNCIYYKVTINNTEYTKLIRKTFTQDDSLYGFLHLRSNIYEKICPSSIVINFDPIKIDDLKQTTNEELTTTQEENIVEETTEEVIEDTTEEASTEDESQKTQNEKNKDLLIFLSVIVGIVILFLVVGPIILEYL